MKVLRFNAEARVHWTLERGEREWVAICDELALTVQGETIEEINHLIVQFMNELFRELLERNELETFLKKHGWTPVDQLPHEVPHEGLKFDLPFQFDSPPSSDHPVACFQ
jgi:hypothetical protein